MAIYAPNELLTYAFDAYHRNNADDLENVILNFYDDVAVRTAKTLIWEKYSDKLPVWKDRRNIVGNPTNAKEKEVNNNNNNNCLKSNIQCIEIRDTSA